MTLPKEFSADQRKLVSCLVLSLDAVTFAHFQVLQRMENNVS